MKINKEFKEYLFASKRRVDEAIEKFEYHSRRFDKKVNEILTGL